MIAWLDRDMKNVYTSDLNNLGGFDIFETLLSSALSTLLILTGSVALAVGQIATILTKDLTSSLFESDTFNGFKQHMLTSADADQLVEIVINGDGTINTKSPSGQSDTAYKSRSATKRESKL